MRSPRSLRRFVASLALNALALAVATSSARAAVKTVAIRPQRTAVATNVDNPANATDDNPATFAGISLKRVCRDDHEQARHGTIVADRFPAGYRPSRLDVAWTARAVFAVMQDNKASVSATVEYTTGDKWQRLESATWTSSSKNCPVIPDGSLTCLGHSTGAEFPPGLDSSRLRVRVTLAAAFSECEPNGMSGVANLVGHAKIYDVRVIATKAAQKPPARRPRP